ncbi:MAG: gamma-glutamyltransferase, partial [Planctomycetota bacterium]
CSVDARSISREVDAGFYDGNLAKRIASTIESGGGLMRVDDLKNYRTIRRDAIHAQANGYDVYGPPPSSSGGITVLMQLKMLEQLRITKPSAAPWTIDQVHLLTETMRRAFRDRAAYLGDPDFAELPGDLLSEKRVRSHVDTIDRNRATRSDALLGDMKQTYLPAHESPQTTHFSIVDAAGMMVSNTYTLEARFGSHIVVPGTGILLNNEMGDFNWQPGVTNDLGAIGTQPNTIAGGKRMLSSQSPTIVKRNGRAILAVGSPGGRTIINTVTQVLVQRIFFGRSLEDAVNAPRFHHQWLPDSLVMERDSE